MYADSFLALHFRYLYLLSPVLGIAVFQVEFLRHVNAVKSETEHCVCLKRCIIIFYLSIAPLFSSSHPSKCIPIISIRSVSFTLQRSICTTVIYKHYQNIRTNYRINNNTAFIKPQKDILNIKIINCDRASLSGNTFNFRQCLSKESFLQSLQLSPFLSFVHNCFAAFDPIFTSGDMLSIINVVVTAST